MIFDRLQRPVTCFKEFAETRTYLPSPNFLMTYFEAKYHAMIVETPKNEAMKGEKIVTAPRIQVMRKNYTQKIEFRRVYWLCQLFKATSQNVRP